MTYNVFGETLNLTQSLTFNIFCKLHCSTKYS